VSKRPKGQGSARKLPDGQWQPFKTVKGARIYGPVQNTRSKALNVAKDLKPAAPVSVVPTVSELMESLLTGRWQTDKSESGYVIARTLWEHRVKDSKLGSMLVTDVRRVDAQEWADAQTHTTVTKFNKHKNPLSPATVKRYINDMSGMFSDLVDLEIITSNPFHRLKLRPIPEYRKQVLMPEEINRLLALEWPPALRIVMILTLNGLRRGEILALTWEDFDGDVVAVRKQVVEADGRLFLKPFTKNRKDRLVVLQPWTVSEIEAYRGNRTSGFIVTAPKNPGQPWRPSSLNKAWDKFLSKTEFKEFGRHDGRSTNAMLMLAAGVDIRTAAEHQGNSPAVLAEMYARSNLKTKREGAKKAAQGIG